MVASQNNYHLGHLILDQLRKRPDAICQIDAATGKSETNASVLSRAVRLARCLRRLGAQPGDLLALHGRNHLDLLIPFYAALFNGLTVCGVDPAYRLDDIKQLFIKTKPKIVFCQSEIFLEAVRELSLNTKVVTFYDGQHSMENFIREYHQDNNSRSVDEFTPAVFDTDKIYAFLISTSGTTGFSKLAAHKHKPWIEKIQRASQVFLKDENTVHNRPALNLNSVHWISAIFNLIGMPLFHQCIVQTSSTITIEHVVDIINRYQPVQGFFCGNMMSAILNYDKKCDLTCFDIVRLGGLKVHQEIIHNLRKRIRNDALAFEIYGVTEALGQVFSANIKGPVGSVGMPTAVHQVKLMDDISGEEIIEPNITGHLWIKGPMFAEYYNDPEQTASVISNDGWYKTGDLFYRDNDNYYYFVERIGILIMYKNKFISPLEVMEVIRHHPGVLDVSVTAVPHPYDGEHPVACVVRRPGHHVTAQDIKDLVANKLEDYQHLRGGVIFLDELPKTSTGKEARAKIREIALVSQRQ